MTFRYPSLALSTILHSDLSTLCGFLVIGLLNTLSGFILTGGLRLLCFIPSFLSANSVSLNSIYYTYLLALALLLREHLL